MINLGLKECNFRQFCHDGKQCSSKTDKAGLKYQRIMSFAGNSTCYNEVFPGIILLAFILEKQITEKLRYSVFDGIVKNREVLSQQK